MADKPKKSLLKKGLTVFLIGFFINFVLVGFNIGGLLRELTRLTILVGLVLVIIGLMQKIIKKFQPKK